MKIVSVSFVVRNDTDAADLSNELSNLDFGVYSMGTEIRDLTKKEISEVKSMVPPVILKG
jgi:hypothetical protein